MKLPEDIQRLLARRFSNQHRRWLLNDKKQWPMLLSLNLPTEETALHQTSAVKAWITAWQTWQGAGKLIWCERRWVSLGIQCLPEKLILSEPKEVALWIGQATRWQQVYQRFQALSTLWPALTDILPRYFDVLAEYTEADFLRLTDLLHWFNAHPHCNLYPRQLPIPGLDSKWLESRKKLLTDLLATIQSDGNNLDFFERCGLKAPPRLIRFKILDPALRHQIGNLSDISASVNDLARLNLAATRVLIIENLQTGLALEYMPGTVVFMALGYHVDVLSAIPWIKSTTCFYWGDIDTHGFAILNRARQHLPQLQSVLMDIATLQCCRHLWGNEEKPSTRSELPYLTDTEKAVYQYLKIQSDKNVRLEQERIPWEYVIQALSEILLIV